MGLFLYFYQQRKRVVSVKKGHSNGGCVAKYSFGLCLSERVEQHGAGRNERDLDIALRSIIRLCLRSRFPSRPHVSRRGKVEHAPVLNRVRPDRRAFAGQRRVEAPLEILLLRLEGEAPVCGIFGHRASANSPRHRSHSMHPKLEVNEQTCLFTHSLRRRVFAAGLPGVDAFRSALLVLQASDARPGALWAAADGILPARPACPALSRPPLILAL